MYDKKEKPWNEEKKNEGYRTFSAKWYHHYHHHHQIMPIVQIPLTFLLIIHLYEQPLLMVGSLDSIPCLYRADECKLCQSANTGVSMWRSPQENFTYEFNPVSPAVPSMSCLSYLDGLWDGRQMAIQLLFCGLFLSIFVQNST